MSPSTITYGGSVLQVLESCAYRWHFDGARHRFRRFPRAAKLDGFTDPPWQPYHHLEFPDGGTSFVVALDAQGRSLLSASGHGEACGCEPGATPAGPGAAAAG